MEPTAPNPRPRFPRVLGISLAGTIVLMGLIFVFRLTTQPVPVERSQQSDALANSSDACVVCHRRASPGIVAQFGHSTMAAAKVTCSDCHTVEKDYLGAVEHEGAYILSAPTTARCQRCHETETAQYNQSRHGLPAWVAYAGSQDLTPSQVAAYQGIPEGSFAPDKSRNILAQLEGEKITALACETCHSIGKPAEDGSVGRCQTCHLRHEFSLEQVRKPETCNACHIGPDHPQWEIYHESPHGIAYETGGTKWNWDADPGTLTVTDFPAPTCATCHLSGFGGASTTHDVGDRLTWYLFAPVSERRPAWQDNLVRMQSVCLECHNKTFITDFYAKADGATLAVNDFVGQSHAIMQPLRDNNLITAEPFDEPIEYTEFELWHHWGRTAKFGAWMQGPDYTQWHGGYEIIKALADLREKSDLLSRAAGK